MPNQLLSQYCGSCSAVLPTLAFKHAASEISIQASDDQAFKPSGPEFEI